MGEPVFFCASPACKGLPWAASERPHPCPPAYLRENPDGSVTLLLSRRDADRRALAAKGLDIPQARWAMHRFSGQALHLRHLARKGERRYFDLTEQGDPGIVVASHWASEWHWEVYRFSSYFRNRPDRRGGPYYERRDYVGP